jgi:hypothetical protein
VTNTYQGCDQIARADHDNIVMLLQPVKSCEQGIDCSNSIKGFFATQSAFPSGCQGFDFVYKHADESIFFLLKQLFNALEGFADQLATFAEKLASEGVSVDFNKLTLWIMLSETYSKFLGESAADPVSRLFSLGSFY